MIELFVVSGTMDKEPFHLSFASLDECIVDPGLAGLLDTGLVTCAVWNRNGRVTRDVTTWAELKRQLINNSPTLLRYFL